MEDRSKLTVNSIHVHVGKSINALTARKDAIAIRFSVQINIERPDKSEGEGCWVNIAGEREKVAEAQTYIKCLCAPEDTGSVQYPGELHGYLSDRQIVYSLEREYRVIIELRDGEREDDPGQAIVKGTSLDVALALSAIEDIIATNLSESETSAGGSVRHTYSDETSNKLNSTLIGISDKPGIKLEKKEMAQYSDVMKKLVLSWASADDDVQEVVDISELEDASFSDSDNDENVLDKTIMKSTNPSGFATSTPVIRNEPSTSAVKVEKVINKPQPMSRRAVGAAYVDLTAEKSVKKVSLLDSDDEETPIRRDGILSQKRNHSNSRDNTLTQEPTRRNRLSSSTSSTSYAGGDSSPTSQAEKDISTITLDDDTSLGDITLKTPSRESCDTKVSQLVGKGAARGYDDMEMAQALSLYSDSDLDEQSFFESLSQIRTGEPVKFRASDEGTSAGVSSKVPDPRTIPPTPARRNVALESINKRQIQPTSPSAKAVMPTEKRVKTLTDPSQDILVIPHTAAQPANSVQMSPRRELPQPPTQQLFNQQQQLQQIRAQHSQQFSSQPMKAQPRFDYVQPSTSSYGEPVKAIHNPLTTSNYSQPSTSNIHQLQPSGFAKPPPQSNFNQQPPLPQGRPDLPPLPAAPALPKREPPKTRMVVLDGSNIAFDHGKKFPGREQAFSAEGILLAVNYLQRTYDATSENVKVIVPNFRRRDRLTREAHILDKMAEAQYLVFSPCKTMPGGKKIVPYDDRFILDLAVATDGVVISNDKYADLLYEQNGKYRDVISHRVIMFMFVGDMFMIPEDPMGRGGPTLGELLRPQGMQRPAVIPNQPIITRQYPPQAPPQNYGNQNQFSSLSNNAPNRFSAPPQRRTAAETNNLMKALVDMFPDKSERIRGLLNRHPHEKNADLFAEQLITD